MDLDVWVIVLIGYVTVSALVNVVVSGVCGFFFKDGRFVDLFNIICMVKLGSVVVYVLLVM